jgi:hypothetical protein
VPLAPSSRACRSLVVIAVLASAVWLPVPAMAQPSGHVSLGSVFERFTAVGWPGESRLNLDGTVNLERQFSDARGRLYYDLDAGKYDSPGDWSFFQHDAGVTYRFGRDEAKARKLFLNGSVAKRFNGDAWTAAEYFAIGSGANLEQHPGSSTTVRSGYRVDYRRFSDLSSLTQLEQHVFASVLSNLPSRTTLVGEVKLALKHYGGSVTTTATTTTPVVTSGSGGGYRHGGGMGPGLRTQPGVSSTTSEAGTARLVTGLARVAQSLWDRTGLYGQVTLRRTSGSLTPALVTTPAGFFEDGVYDDPFASDAVFLQGGLTHAFANSAEVAASVWWGDKDYTSTLALNATGVVLTASPLRADRATVAGLSWSQPVFPSKTGPLAVSADVSYRFVRHRSNDTFYNYTSHGAGIALSVGY